MFILKMMELDKSYPHKKIVCVVMHFYKNTTGQTFVMPLLPGMLFFFIKNVRIWAIYSSFRYTVKS